MDKQLFDDAIGEVPPSTVDVDAVIARGRRADRVRRVVNPAVAAGVAVVLLTGTIAFTVTEGDDGDGVGFGQTAPPSMSSTSGEPTTGVVDERPEACQRTDLESADEVVARLTPLVQAKVQALRPELRTTINPANQYPPGVQRGPLEFFQVHNENTAGEVSICQVASSFTAAAATEGPEGPGTIFVVVQPAPRDDPGDCDAEEGLTQCEENTAPNGDRILETTAVQDGATLTRVDVIKQDGTYVIVGTDGPISSGPPLNHEQLTAIGTDPGMTLFP